jgi:hypothetical protein
VGDIDDFIERLESDFKELQKKYKIIWKDGIIRQKVIDIITGADKRREDYRKAFKVLVWEKISKKRGHFLAKEPDEGWKGEPISAKEIMNVLYNVKTEGKKEYYEIEEIIVCDYYIDRKLLIPDVFR